VQQRFHELWALIYDVVEIKLIIIGNSHFRCPDGGEQRKYYTLMDLLVHDEQNEQSPIFVALLF